MTTTCWNLRATQCHTCVLLMEFESETEEGGGGSQHDSTCRLWGQISCYSNMATNREAGESPQAFYLCKSDHKLSFTLSYPYFKMWKLRLSYKIKPHIVNRPALLQILTDENWWSYFLTPQIFQRSSCSASWWEILCLLRTPKAHQMVVVSCFCASCSVTFNNCTMLSTLFKRAHHLFSWGRSFQSITEHYFCIIHFDAILPHNTRYLKWYLLWKC